MDDRQTQIRSGAGLDESRINQDFLDFLSKWSTPVLWLLVLVGGAWWGLRYLKERRIERTNQAYASLTEATSGGNPSPTTLKTIASQFDDVGAVPELALLRAADIYLRSAIAGVEPGSEIDPTTGRAVSESDELDETDMNNYMSEAASVSRKVIDLVGEDPGKQMVAMQAWMRLGAAQEGLGSIDEAKSSYGSAAQAARNAGFPAIAQLAESRAATAGTVELGKVLPSNDDLVALPGEELPPIETTGELTMPEVIDDAVDAVEDAADDAEADDTASDPEAPESTETQSSEPEPPANPAG